LIVLSPTATSDMNNNLLVGEKRLEKQIKCLDYPFCSQKADMALSNVLLSEQLDKMI